MEWITAHYAIIGYALSGTLALFVTSLWTREGEGFSILDWMAIIVIGPLFGWPLVAIVCLLVGIHTDALTKPRWFIREGD